MNGKEYVELANKYEDNQEVMQLVVYTYNGAKAAYMARGLAKGFVLGVTTGMALSLIVACVAWFIN